MSLYQCLCVCVLEHVFHVGGEAAVPVTAITPVTAIATAAAVAAAAAADPVTATATASSGM